MKLLTMTLTMTLTMIVLTSCGTDEDCDYIKFSKCEEAEETDSELTQEQPAQVVSNTTNNFYEADESEDEVEMPKFILTDDVMTQAEAIANTPEGYYLPSINAYDALRPISDWSEYEGVEAWTSDATYVHQFSTPAFITDEGELFPAFYVRQD